MDSIFDTTSVSRISSHIYNSEQYDVWRCHFGSERDYTFFHRSISFFFFFKSFLINVLSQSTKIQNPSIGNCVLPENVLANSGWPSIYFSRLPGAWSVYLMGHTKIYIYVHRGCPEKFTKIWNRWLSSPHICYSNQL